MDKIRLTISLNPEFYELINKISKLQKTSINSVISQLIENNVKDYYLINNIVFNDNYKDKILNLIEKE